jgi:glycosyltransferase involved in cell wall biosynthesis
MPFISVLVPTRERCETLHYALKTLCDQEFSDVEFIVSDNFSNDDTAGVVKRFDDPRIRYIRTPQRLSMTENFCFALGHAQGTYVTVLGDDDGFTPGALSVLAKWALQTGADAIKWHAASYYWPNHSRPERRGALEVPLLTADWNVSAKAAFTAGKWGLLRWDILPIIYGGLVKLEVMNRIRALTGEYLLSHIPDVYSAFAISGTIDRYIYTEYPFSTLGFSGRSMASAYHSSWTTGEINSSDTFSVFLQESDVALHPDFQGGDLRLESAAMLDCLYRVRDSIFKGRLYIPFSAWLYRLVFEANRVNEPLRSDLMSRLQKIAYGRHRGWLFSAFLKRFAVSKMLRTAAEHRRGWLLRPFLRRFTSSKFPHTRKVVEAGRLALNGAEFEVADIEGACRLVGKLRPIPTVPLVLRDAGFMDLLKLKQMRRSWTS